MKIVFYSLPSNICYLITFDNSNYYYCFLNYKISESTFISVFFVPGTVLNTVIYLFIYYLTKFVHPFLHSTNIEFVQ